MLTWAGQANNGLIYRSHWLSNLPCTSTSSSLWPSFVFQSLLFFVSDRCRNIGAKALIWTNRTNRSSSLQRNNSSLPKRQEPLPTLPRSDFSGFLCKGPNSVLTRYMMKQKRLTDGSKSILQRPSVMHPRLKSTLSSLGARGKDQRADRLLELQPKVAHRSYAWYIGYTARNCNAGPRVDSLSGFCGGFLL